jgi:hypothetical protein
VDDHFHRWPDANSDVTGAGTAALITTVLDGRGGPMQTNGKTYVV